MFNLFLNKYFQTLLVFSFFVFIFYGGSSEELYPFPSTDLLVNIKEDSIYDVGDIVFASNSKNTLNVRAEQITLPKKTERNTHGNLKEGTLLEFYYKKIYQYKFERISEESLVRTNLQTGLKETLSNTANEKGEYIHIPLYISRQKNVLKDRARIFGNPGEEYWYGGEISVTNENMNEVWNEIEKTTREKRNYNFPFSEQEKNNFLLIKTSDMTDSEVSDLLSPKTDNSGRIEVLRGIKLDVSSVGTHSKDLRQSITDTSNLILKK